MSKKLSHLTLLLGLLVLVLGVMNTEHFPPWTAFHSEAPAFFSGFLLLLACLLAGTARVTAPVVILLLLAATAWVQWGWGKIPYAGDAWVVTAYVGTFAAAWIAGCSTSGEERRRELLEALCWVLLAMAALASFQCLVQWARVGDQWIDWVFLTKASSRPLGNLGQPNQTATLLLMGIASTSLFLVKRRLGRWAAWPLFILLGAAVVLTQSRTALLSASLLVLSLGLFATRAPSLRPYVVDGVIWLLLMFAGSWMLQAAPLFLSEGTVGSAAMVAVGSRPLLWTQLLLASLEEPWFGFGWLQISTAQQVGALQYPGIEQTNYAHNIMLDAMVMLGVPLTAAVVGAALYWIIGRTRRLSPTESGLVGVLFILLPLLVHAQLELPHAYSYFLVPAGLLLGLFDAATRRDDQGVRAGRPALAVMVTLWLTVLLALGHEYVLAEEDFRVNRFENRRLGTTPADYVKPDLVLLTQFKDMLDAMRLRAGRNMSARDLDILARSSRRFTWAPLQFRTALSLALNGRHLEAQQHLLVIRNLFTADIAEEAKENWERLQRESYPELAAVPFPEIR